MRLPTPLTPPLPRLLVLVLCVGIPCGCGRKQDPRLSEDPPLTPEQTAAMESEYLPLTNEPPTSASENPPAETADASAAPLPQRPAVERLNGAIHAQLTVQLRMFIEKNGRVPQNFSEFANSAMDSVPLAPSGMKFVIDPADRTVKVVRR